MTLQHELTTLPKQALTVLHFMSSYIEGTADLTTLEKGTGLSERSLGKAVKRLVTRNFMAMDAARFYHLTPKGTQAIELLATGEFDGTNDDDSLETVTYDLCAIVPNELVSGKAAEWQVGIHPAEGETIDSPAEVYLQISAENANVRPGTVTINTSPTQPMKSANLTIIANAPQGYVRVRIEAFQLFEMDEPGDAGGMYFDIPIGNNGSTQVRAIHIPISLV